MVEISQDALKMRRMSFSKKVTAVIEYEIEASIVSKLSSNSIVMTGLGMD